MLQKGEEAQATDILTPEQEIKEPTVLEFLPENTQNISPIISNQARIRPSQESKEPNNARAGIRRNSLRVPSPGSGPSLRSPAS